jgi:phosphohistidine phosphatase SixA
MEIYLVRTATLEPGLAEGAAPLSLEGRRLVRALGNRVRSAEGGSVPDFARVIIAPTVGAAQTAELFAERTDFLGAVDVLPALATAQARPETYAAKILEVPAGAERDCSIVVVADEPALSALGAFLIGRPTFPPLMHGQVSVLLDRKPGWCLRPGEKGRGLLLVS